VFPHPLASLELAGAKYRLSGLAASPNLCLIAICLEK
jgi:hypothetical protein